MDILAGLNILLLPENMFFSVVGTLAGILIGAIPGLGPSLAVAMLVSMTFGMSTATALIIIGGIYAGSIYGGSISSVMFKAPGTAASAASTLDGYPLAKKGRAGEALGIIAMASFLGGMFGCFFLVFLSPPISRISVMLGPTEYFVLCLLGLTVISIATLGDFLKGLISGTLGLFCSFVGFSNITGESRFTYGVLHLEEGIQFVPMVIGIFAIAEMLLIVQKSGTLHRAPTEVSNVLLGAKEVLKRPFNVLRSGIIGALVGALPATGAPQASFLSYALAKRSSKDNTPFGKGNLDGLVAPETANNATVGGVLIPTLTLGIPGNPVAAILIGALLIHGLVPGRQLFTTQAPITYAFFLSLFLGNIWILLFGLSLSKYLVKLSNVSINIVVPAVLVFCMIGSFSIRNSYFDMYLAVIFGLIGYFLVRNGYSMASFIIGLVLGPLLEVNYYRAMLMSGGSYDLFIQRPITLTLIIINVLIIAWPSIKKYLFKKRKPENIIVNKN